MKKAICIAVVVAMIVLLFCGPLAQQSKAFAVAGTLVIGTVIAFLALCGITLVAVGMSQSSFENWVSEKLDEWATDMGSPLDHLLNSAGIGTTISGLLVLGSEFAQNVRNFATWLKNDMQLQDNSVQQVIAPSGIDGNGYVTVNGRSYYAFETSETIQAYNLNITVTPTQDYPVLMYQFVNNSNNLMAYAFASFANFIVTGVNTTGMYSYTYEQGSPQMPWKTTFGYSQSYLLSGLTTFPGTTAADSENMNRQVYEDLTDIMTTTPTGGLQIDTDTIDIPTIEVGEQVYIDTGALPGDPADVIAQGVITQVLTGDLTIEGGEVAEEEPPYIITGPVAVSGLAEVFPFCIPFDLYNFFAVLASDPVAPSFDWRFYVPGLVDETITIDFEPFETAAQILRTMELLLFCVGLAFETRKIIRS